MQVLIDNAYMISQQADYHIHKIAIEIQYDTNQEDLAEFVLNDLLEKFKNHISSYCTVNNIKVLHMDYNEQAIMDMIYTLMLVHNLPIKISGEYIEQNRFNNEMYDKIVNLLREHYKVGKLESDNLDLSRLERQAIEEREFASRKN